MGHSRTAASLSAAVAAGVLLAVSLAGGASAARPVASAAGTCHISASQGEELGPTYVTYIAVSGGVSCAQAKKLVHSYYECRVKHGGVSGHCSGVEGFRCSEHRFGVIKVQYDASVTCTRGREVVRHNYTQFT